MEGWEKLQSCPLPPNNLPRMGHFQKLPALRAWSLTSRTERCRSGHLGGCWGLLPAQPSARWGLGETWQRSSLQPHLGTQSNVQEEESLTFPSSW